MVTQHVAGQLRETWDVRVSFGWLRDSYETVGRDSCVTIRRDSHATIKLSNTDKAFSFSFAPTLSPLLIPKHDTTTGWRERDACVV